MPRIRCWPLLSAVLIAAAVALGVISTRTTLLTAADQRMSERLYTSDEGLVGALATVFDLVFSPVAGVVIAAALIGGLLLARRGPQAVQSGTVLLVGWLSAAVIKRIIARPRPEYAVQSGDSFPSGHTALATALLIAVCLLLRSTSRDVQDTAVICGSLALVGVCFARVAIGGHYFSDTVGAVLWTGGVCLAVIGMWPHLEPFLPRWARADSGPDRSAGPARSLPG